MYWYEIKQNLIGSVNFFQFAGDVSHIAAIITLLYRLMKAKNARGMFLTMNDHDCTFFCFYVFLFIPCF